MCFLTCFKMKTWKCEFGPAWIKQKNPKLDAWIPYRKPSPREPRGQSGSKQKALWVEEHGAILVFWVIPSQPGPEHRSSVEQFKLLEQFLVIPGHGTICLLQTIPITAQEPAQASSHFQWAFWTQLPSLRGQQNLMAQPQPGTAQPALAKHCCCSRSLLHTAPLTPCQPPQTTGNSHLFPLQDFQQYHQVQVNSSSNLCFSSMPCPSEVQPLSDPLLLFLSLLKAFQLENSLQLRLATQYDFTICKENSLKHSTVKRHCTSKNPGNKAPW